ncbi:MAG: TRAP transporter large permease [Sedimentisphaerales bacterium]|nr:TRAP transporter large permease [Sedimentisphaerales bacterium]
METPILILIATFILFLLMNVPIAVGIGLSTLITLFYIGNLDLAAQACAQRLATGIDEFALLAIPFFILSGLLMGKGGIARRLIDFANALVGHFTGGLSYVNVLTCMLFGSISGSSVAAVSSVGGFMIPEMNKKGYGNEFNVSVTTTAATTGLMIPPSNIMIVYALVATESVAAMFMAGVFPGILFGLFLMVVCGIISKRRGYGAGDKVAPLLVLWKFLVAVPCLLLMVIILGGILLGYFTATEAAAVAVVYSFVLAVVVYREVKIRDLPGILLQCGITTAVVMLLVGTSTAMSWMMARENIPQDVSKALLGLSENSFVIFLVINALLLFVGTFMDMTPAVLIFAPIFLPVVKSLGMHPVHFGAIMVANLCIGICTPPVGTCLFVGCGVGNTTIAKVFRHIIPFYIAMIAALMLVTYIPALSMWLPVKLKLIGGG